MLRKLETRDNFIEIRQSLHSTYILCIQSKKKHTLITVVMDFLYKHTYIYRHTKQSLTQTNHIRLCINTIRSPDDKRC